MVNVQKILQRKILNVAGNSSVIICAARRDGQSIIYIIISWTDVRFRSMSAHRVYGVVKRFSVYKHVLEM